MNRKIVITTIMLILISFGMTANAMEIEYAKMKDVSSSLMTVKGATIQGDNNRLATVTIKGNGDLASKYHHIDIVEIGADGKFEYDFIFSQKSDNYNVTVKCGVDEGTASFAYTNTAELKTFISDLANGKFTDVFEAMNKYSTSLNVDLSSFKTDSQRKIVSKRINQSKAEILAALNKNDLNAISHIVAKAKTEVELLNKIEKTLLWSGVNAILTSSTDVTGIDFGQYNTLSDTQKMSVDSKIVQRIFVDADDLKATFDKLVDEELNAKKPSGGGGSGGGGSSGGGGGSGGGDSLSGGNGNIDISAGIKKDEAIKEVPSTFSDVKEGDWSFEAIEYLAGKNIVSGSGNGEFNPNGNVKREEITKMIVEAFGLQNDGAVADFDDVDSSAWYYKYVASAKNAKVINGVSDSLFGTGEDMTRQDLATILYRISKSKELVFETEYKGFADFADVADYAKEAVAFMGGEKIINGSNNSFNPNDFTTRAEAAKLIYEVLKLI